MEIITFEQIYDLVRNEKTHEELCEIDQEIISQIGNYLKTKQKIIEDSKDKVIPSELEKLNIQLNSARSLAKEFYDRREKKIVLLALNKSKVPDIETGKLLEHEKDLMLHLSAYISEHREKILENMFNPSVVYSDEKGMANKEETEDKSDVPFQNSDDKKVPEQLMMVRFVAEQHKFYGPNLEIYGPFKEGDIANLPKIIVDILLNHKKAIKIT